MKKISVYLFILFISLFYSCHKDDINDDSSITSTNKLEIIYDYKSELKRDFAKALVKTMSDNVEIRKLIKEEALKMFDKDYDVLYQLVKDNKISDNKTFRDALASNFEDEDRLSEIENNLPLLTIFVPKLPEGSFSAENWDTSTDIPEVAIRMTTTNHVPMFRSNNEEYILEGGQIPGFPVVVIKENERIVVNTPSLKFNKNVKGSNLKSSDDNYEFKFLDDVFNNVTTSKNKSLESKNSSNSAMRTAMNLDQKLIDAYNIYKNADGWQRDYIYYNLTPSNIKDQFQYDFQEHVTQFSLKGDATAAYNKVSDQTGDPTYNYFKVGASSSSWTGGDFEFKVRVLLNGKNGVGTELITYFPASPEELFDVTYSKTFWNIYRFKSISLKAMNINLPLFNWDLNQYSASVKIGIEEVDLTVTTVLTDTRTVKFANNFSIDPTDGILKKIGLKFGSSLETTTTQTIQKTFTQGNDELGEVIINFADDVVLSNTGSTSITRDYSTGWYTISLEPMRVQ